MVVVLRLALGALLALGAVAKLRRPAPARVAAVTLGTPARMAGIAVAAVSVAEAAIAVLLVGGLRPRAAAAGAAALFVAFAGGLLLARLRGVAHLACGCFGLARGRPTLLLAARAGLLAGLAVAVATAAGERVPSPSFQIAAEVAIGLLALAVAVLTVLLAALYRQVGVLERRLAPRSFLALADEGPAIDRAAPSLPGASRQGPELVVFGSARCILCRELAPGLSALADDGLPVLPVDVDLDPGVAESFAVPGTPYAVLLVDGSVAAKGLVNTLEQVELLVDAGVGRVGARAVA